MNALIKYGANEERLLEALTYPDKTLGRVASQFRDLYRLVTEQGECLAEVTGNFRHTALHLSDYPAVGDYVMFTRSDTVSNAQIHTVLNRTSVFSRTAVGVAGEIQVIAANINYVFICMALNADFNLSRLERYLSVAYNSKAKPVVVLTKADLCEDIDYALETVDEAAFACDVIYVTSEESESAAEKLEAYLKPGDTACFIGSSGVGKSTLINILAGKKLMETNGLRNDDKGRHTTTRREMLVTEKGFIVIDTPGLRELGIEADGISDSFSDIEELSEKCRFNDCTHTNEPGCAVLAAIEAGELTNRRYENYQKLVSESAYFGMTSRQIENEKINKMFGSKKQMKSKMDYYKKRSK